MTMTTRAVEAIEEWESAPFDDGYRGLHELAADEFSGVVESGGARLCMLNGTVVGILDGTIDDFEDAAGTAYDAPSPALPLLVLMQERNDEVRAKYYTEDTPISEVDQTLSDGGFTGFVELSENVLSGDYFVVYHGGRSMAVAFVGESRQLLTDDEAFDRADGEVGIYQVRPAEVETIEIPEAEPEPEPEPAPEPETEAKPEPGPGSTTAAAASADDGTDDPAADTASGSESGAAPTADAPAETGDREREDGTDSAAADSVTDADEPDDADASPEPATEADSSPGSDDESSVASPDGASTGDAADSTPDRERSGGAAEDGNERGAEGPTAAESGAASASDGESATDRPAGSEGSPAGSRTGEDGEAGERPRSSDESASGGESRAADDRARAGGSRASESGSDGAGRTGASGRSGGARRADEQGRDGARPSNAGESGRRSESRGATDESSGDSSTAASSASRLETRSIPSLDPSRTGKPKSNDVGDAGGTIPGSGAPTAAGSEPGGRESSGSEPSSSPDPSEGESRTARTAEQRSRPARRSASDSGTERAEGRSQSTPERSGADAAGGAERSTGEGQRSRQSGGTADGSPAEPEAGARVADLEAELEEREAEIEELEADLAAAETERDDLRSQLETVRGERDDLRSRLDDAEAERDRVRSERDDLESEVDRLETEVDRLETEIRQVEDEYGAATDAERRMSPGEALDQTNLFVRYESKGQATLESAHSGNASRQEVGENIDLEDHTQFEKGAVSVGGRPFDEFLRETIQYQFVTWVVNDLLYEIRDTGAVPALQKLYDAIPRIDRAELNGTVSAEYTEDGQERRTQESFDVVMRDRMGNPLMAANLNDSRQAASESMMSSLVTASSHVGESSDSLAASFLVTSSFFEPEALETAAEATSGGLLSRDKRESFVKLTRKQGYHLCLVEAREDKFHLAVPEL